MDVLGTGLGIFSIYLFWIYLRLFRAPGIILLALINIIFFALTLENRLFRILIYLIGAIISFSLYPVDKRFKVQYKEKKHLFPSKKFLFLQMFRFFLPMIFLTSLFCSFYFFFKFSFYKLFAHLTIDIGLLLILFQFWRICPFELQELYFRPKGKKAIYFRFVECIVFSVILEAMGLFVKDWG